MAANEKWRLVLAGPGVPNTEQANIQDLPPQQRENLVITLEEAGILEITINPERAFDFKTLSVTSSQGDFQADQFLRRHENIWRLDRLSPDSYRINLMAQTTANGQPTYHRETKTIEVLGGETYQIDLAEKNILRIQGQAIWNGVPLVTASVFLLKE